MAAHKVTVIPGDGIGPEVTNAALRVLGATGIAFDWDFHPAGESARKMTGSYLPGETTASIERNRIALKGPTATPTGEGHRSVNVELRQIFDLFANVRPFKTMAGVHTKFSGIDIALFRENTEDLYIGEERLVDENPDIAEAVSRITKHGSERIARYAFEYAKRHRREKITVVHKANIMKLTHGLFLSTAHEIGLQYPGIGYESMLADNFMMQLVRKPREFDCVLAPNFLGDLISDLTAGLVGGLGFAPGANIGKDCAIFEAVHGTAPDIAGKGIANPSALIMSGALMLEYLGEPDVASRISWALALVLANGIGTADIDPVDPQKCVGTDEFAKAVIERL